MKHENFSYYLPLSKVEKTSDGFRMVSGYASTPALDIEGEIISLDAVKTALPGYMEWRNIRQMHQPLAVGLAKEANVDEKGLYLTSKIVDLNAIRLLDEGVLKGYSIGGKKLAKRGNVVTEIELIEVSLVDRPANPECRLDAVKSASGKLALYGPDEGDGTSSASETEVGWLRKTVERALGMSSAVKRKPTTFLDDVGHEDDTADVAKAAAAAKAADTVVAVVVDDAFTDFVKAVPDLFGNVIGAVDPSAVPLLIDFAKSPDSILFLEPDARERLAKGITVVAELAYAFDNIRRAQRRLVAEGFVEKDGGDNALAEKLGSIASELATVMAQKATHEGAEATSLTDADDLTSWELRQGIYEMNDKTGDLAKRGADVIKAGLGKASGHLIKAGKSNGETMSCVKKLGKMIGDHAQKSAEVAKAGGTAPGFDFKSAAALVKAAFDNSGESNDHLEMASVAMARLANGTVTGDHGVSGVSQGTMTEGSVPWYDAAQTYAGKAAKAAKVVVDEDEDEDETPATVVKTFTQAEVDALTKTAKLEAENDALRAQLSKSPAGAFKARTVLASTGEDGDDMSVLMKGVAGVDQNDPKSVQDAGAAMIGNMIANPGRFGKSVFDPTFKGQAGTKRASN